MQDRQERPARRLSPAFCAEAAAGRAWNGGGTRGAAGRGGPKAGSREESGCCCPRRARRIQVQALTGRPPPEPLFHEWRSTLGKRRCRASCDGAHRRPQGSRGGRRWPRAGRTRRRCGRGQGGSCARAVRPSRRRLPAGHLLAARSAGRGETVQRVRIRSGQRAGPRGAALLTTQLPAHRGRKGPSAAPAIPPAR